MFSAIRSSGTTWIIISPKADAGLHRAPLWPEYPTDQGGSYFGRFWD